MQYNTLRKFPPLFVKVKKTNNTNYWYYQQNFQNKGLMTVSLFETAPGPIKPLQFWISPWMLNDMLKEQAPQQNLLFYRWNVACFEWGLQNGCCTCSPSYGNKTVPHGLTISQKSHTFWKDTIHHYGKYFWGKILPVW